VRKDFRQEVARAIQNVLGGDFVESLEEVVKGNGRKVSSLEVHFLGAQEVAAEIAKGSEPPSAVREHIGFRFTCNMRRGEALHRYLRPPD